jgi:signal transduction histidine kinase
VLNILSILIALVAVAISIYFVVKNYKAKAVLEKREQDVSRKMYELAILKELGDRIGYSLDVQQIIDIIISSLRQFIDYSAVSYMLLAPEKVIFKIHLERSVHRRFVNEIRDRMLGSLGALLDREFKKEDVKEILSGAIIIEELDEPVRSFFNIPLVIDEKVVGVLTVADTKSGLYKEEEMTILYKIIQQASKAVTSLQGVVKTEQRKLNSMVESMADGVVMTDNDYKVVVANPAVKHLLNLEKKPEPNIFDFIENLGGKFDIRGKLEESIKLGKILDTPEALIGEKFFQILVAPVRSSATLTSGEILGAVVIFHDITHEKELEDLRKDFTSMMVHELRSPLDGINKMADLIIRKKAELKTKKIIGEYLPIIFKSSSDMLRLVSNLLDAAKVESGKYQVLKEPNGNIKKIVEDRLKFYEPSAKEAHIKLLPLVDKDVPESVSLDPNAITEVFNNLISNSLKFGRVNEDILIQVFAHKTDGDIIEEAKKAGVKWFVKEKDSTLAHLPYSIVATVTDFGFGISKDNIALLFNKFRQFKSAAQAPEKKGTGLGLVIMKGIVEAHNGVVGVASEEGVGTTFYFTIPIEVGTQ